jgi:hypothetical protein
MSDADPPAAVADGSRARVVGCAVTGPKHEADDSPCEDASAGRTLPGGRFVVAVADGLGSASRAAEGSRLATDRLVGHLADALSAADDPGPAAMEARLETGFQTARTALAERADELDAPVSALNTTLLAAVGGPSGVAGGAVGDGGVVRHHDGEHHLLVPREDDYYTSRTTPLQSDRWRENVRFAHHAEADGAAVFSDGLDNAAWAGGGEIQDSLFDQLFAFVRSTADRAAMEAELESFLDHERFRRHSRDDKSIALATLLPAVDDGADADADAAETDAAETDADAAESDADAAESDADETVETDADAAETDADADATAETGTDEAALATTDDRHAGAGPGGALRPRRVTDGWPRTI